MLYKCYIITKERVIPDVQINKKELKVSKLSGENFEKE